MTHTSCISLSALFLSNIQLLSYIKGVDVGKIYRQNNNHHKIVNKSKKDQTLINPHEQVSIIKHKVAQNYTGS